MSVRHARVYFQIIRLSHERFVWRMLSHNGREAGRSVHTRTSVAECFDELLALQRSVNRAQLDMVIQPGGQRRWVARLDDAVLARSSVAYQREWDLRRGFDLFCACAAVGLIDPLVVTADRRR